jgi:hypothetical protein
MVWTMTCEELAERFVDHMTAGVRPEDDPKIAAHLASCAVCRDRVEQLPELWETLGRIEPPSTPPGLAERLAREAGPRVSTSAVRPIPGRSRLLLLLAAACLAGLFAGAGVMRMVSGSRDDGKLAALEDEVELLRHVAGRALDARQSPALRAAAVSAVRHREDAAVDPLLLHVLRTDPVVGVRLAAVAALEPRAGDPTVRSGLSAALLQESTAHVQLALLRVLSKGTDTAPILARFLAREDLEPSVRDVAERMASDSQRKADL